MKNKKIVIGSVIGEMIIDAQAQSKETAVIVAQAQKKETAVR